MYASKQEQYLNDKVTIGNILHSFILLSLRQHLLSLLRKTKNLLDSINVSVSKFSCYSGLKELTALKRNTVKLKIQKENKQLS